MARDYGKVFTNIWSDQNFKSLSGNAQRVYFQLISQPDLSMAGVLTLAAKRWALQTADQGERDISEALDELEGHAFVVVDTDTQEVLVRSYIRRDLGWKSPTTMKAIASSARSVLSTVIKRRLAVEFQRIDTSVLSSKISDKTGQSTREVVEGYLNGLISEFEALPDTPSDTPRHTPSDTPADGFSSRANATETETATETEPEPAPATAPAPANIVSPADAVDAPPNLPDLRDDVHQLCEHLANRIEDNGSKRPTIGKTWHDAARLMIDRDGRNPQEIHAAINWCQNDEFWRSNILSMPKLREKYDQMRLQAERKNTPTRASGDIDWDAAMERARAKDARQEGAA